MNMEEVKQFMKEVDVGFLATTDGSKVGVRPMSGWAWMGGELWCASHSSSPKVTELKAVANAEYCFCDDQGKHVRITGACKISCDNDEKLRLYKANPALKNHIEDPAAVEYVVIKLVPSSIRVMDPVDMEYEQVSLTD